MSRRQFVVSVPVAPGLKLHTMRRAIRDAIRSCGDFYGQPVSVHSVPGTVDATPRAPQRRRAGGAA